MPATLTVLKGAQIIFHNEDNVPHTATPVSGAEFDPTGTLAPGLASGPITFNKLGDNPYRCEIHPEMLGRIIVVEEKK